LTYLENSLELSELGFNDWFRKRRDELHKTELNVARITRVDRDRYLVRNERGEVRAEATGRLLYAADMNQDLPCVGDWTLVQYYNDGAFAIIHELLPRRTFLRRKLAGKRVDYQMIASNIDVAFIMQSCDSDFNIRRMERYIVMVKDGRIEPVILLSKTDLIGAEGLEKRLSDIGRACSGVRVIAFSSKTGVGLQTLRETLEKGKTYCLLGSSGVGKTTLLNHLLGREEFETQPVREKDGKGRHTTARRQLTLLGNGALLIDTPGMRELGMIGASSGIDETFSDIHALSADCRFKDCTHTTETGCSVLAAVGNKELSEERYRSYLKLMKESDFYQMSYAERRRKDKEFGRMINVAKKQLRKRKS
jgi:ribosome biogenesis GTPase / thiamine phosphate phosphatase